MNAAFVQPCGSPTHEKKQATESASQQVWVWRNALMII